jgi:hypothetical protein
LGTESERRREVECIMSQGEWEHLDARIDRTQGQAFDDKQAEEASGFELSALYECHDGPHLLACPRYKRQPLGSK